MGHDTFKSRQVSRYIGGICRIEPGAIENPAKYLARLAGFKISLDIIEKNGQTEQQP
jgi:hypothetical protein